MNDRQSMGRILLQDSSGMDYMRFTKAIQVSTYTSWTISYWGLEVILIRLSTLVKFGTIDTQLTSFLSERHDSELVMGAIPTSSGSNMQQLY